jgi:hypothetical protein
MIYLVLLMAGGSAAYSQVPDTTRVIVDTTAPARAERLPVLRDTLQYNDTSIVNTPHGKDTIVKKKVHSPRGATIRSAIIPGWGQIYNKKYWKVPLVYGAIGFPMYLFFDNKKWYNRTRYALSIVVNDEVDDPEKMAKVHPQLVQFVEAKAQASLVNYRNSFRRDMDYSILFTILMYGINIIDATVDGHLKGFDVSDDLTLHIKPAFLQGTTTPGIALVVNFK